MPNHDSIRRVLYHVLPITDQDQNEEGKPNVRISKSRYSASALCFLFLRVILVLLALWGLIDLCQWTFRARQIPRNSHHLCACGSSPQEASSLGCKYDPFAAAWLPDACRDDELIAEFKNMEGHHLEYYNYPQKDTRLDLGEVSQLGGKGEAAGMVYTTTDWHHMHCLYLWRQFYRLRTTDRIMAPHYDNEHHIKHCQETIWDQMLNPLPMDAVEGVSAVMIF